jgi:DnaJ-class molecular chaperone
MNLIKNYYAILGVSNNSTNIEIKKSYYKLSFKHHPDKGGSEEIFSELTEAYDILMDDNLRQEYDKKSRFGKDYDELQELFNINIEYDFKKENQKYEEFKKNAVLNVVEKVDKNTFNGIIEYRRWVMCKSCNGSGKDLKSKFVIKDEFGNIKGIFDSDDGCDFCEGSGKDYLGNKCAFCFGQGKIGINNCQKCEGEKRILGKQKLNKIKLDLTSDETIIKHMGHFSKNEPGKVGDLILIHHLPDPIGETGGGVEPPEEPLL